jgi:hypothetical protein
LIAGDPMKFLFLFFITSGFCFSAEKKLQKGIATYEVRALIKTVQGKSEDLRGKMICLDGQCDYLLAAPVKTFRSSDSNRDLNMLTVLEAEKFPFVSVRGKVPESQIQGGTFSTEAKVTFHGVEKAYLVKVTSGKSLIGDFVLDLEAHLVSRPSLLTVKIENAVPIHFELFWQ